MLSHTFAKLTFVAVALGSSVFAAGSPPLPKIITGSKYEVKTSPPPTSLSTGRSTRPFAPPRPKLAIDPWVPTEADLIYNHTTLHIGDRAVVGWIDPHSDNPDPWVTNGHSKNITVYYTPAGGEEEFFFGSVIFFLLSFFFGECIILISRYVYLQVGKRSRN
jgi:hypothetical protein